MRTIGWILLVLLGVSCASGRASGKAYWGSEQSERGAVMSLDDVTNGLVNPSQMQRASATGSNPLAGAFFNDGGEDDVRARTENYFVEDLGRGSGYTAFGSRQFVDTDDDGLPDAVAPGTEPPAPPSPPGERMLIYTGEVQVEVAHAEESAARFLADIEALGGYLQQQAGTSMTLRLPATAFDDAFEKARGMGRVLAEARRANDVTEEFVDLGIRIDNARKSRDRLLEVLKIAEKVEDILKVEAELRRLTEELERMEGRRTFLQDQVTMATLHVDFRAVAAPPPARRVQRPSRFGWVNRVGVRAVMEGF